MNVFNGGFEALLESQSHADLVRQNSDLLHPRVPYRVVVHTAKTAPLTSSRLLRIPVCTTTSFPNLCKHVDIQNWEALNGNDRCLSKHRFVEAGRQEALMTGLVAICMFITRECFCPAKTAVASTREKRAQNNTLMARDSFASGTGGQIFAASRAKCRVNKIRANVQ